MEKEKRIKKKIHKKHLFPQGQKNNRTNTRTTQLFICNKKGNKEKEDTKQKQEELNKPNNELKNLIEILKMITKETIKEHISTIPDECETHNQNQEKIP